MFVQAPRIVLCKHGNLIDVGIGHIAQRKVDSPVASCDGHGTDRPLLGQLLDPVIVAACQDYSDCSHCLSPALIKVLPLGRLPSA